MKKRLFMPVNLQFFSEPGDGGSGDGDNKKTHQLAHKRHRPKQKKKTLLAKHFLVMK